MKWSWIGAITVVAGILVLVFPLIINWIIGITLIVIGVFNFLER